MTWFDVFVAYLTVCDAVVSTARVWVPVLVAVAALAAGVRPTARRRHRRTRRPDTSGQDSDTTPDIAALVSRPRPDLPGHRPDMPAVACPDMSES